MFLFFTIVPHSIHIKHILFFPFILVLTQNWKHIYSTQYTQHKYKACISVQQEVASRLSSIWYTRSIWCSNQFFLYFRGQHFRVTYPLWYDINTIHRKQCVRAALPNWKKTMCVENDPKKSDKNLVTHTPFFTRPALWCVFQQFSVAHSPQFISRPISTLAHMPVFAPPRSASHTHPPLCIALTYNHQHPRRKNNFSISRKPHPTFASYFKSVAHMRIRKKKIPNRRKTI